MLLDETEDLGVVSAQTPSVHALKVRPRTHAEAVAIPAFMRSCGFPSNLFTRAAMESRLMCAPIAQEQRCAAEGTMKNTRGRKMIEMLLE